MAKAKLGYVYFIHAPEVGRIKIGYSAEHPDARLACIRTDSPVVLERMGVLRGGLDLERQLHAKFRHLRQRREWFHAGVDLVAFIAERAKPWDVRIASSKEDRAKERDDVRRLENLFGEWHREHFGVGDGIVHPTFAAFCDERGVPFTRCLPAEVMRRVARGEPCPTP